jgi:CubicO group peptidase (beta-lactamase class C family)
MNRKRSQQKTFLIPVILLALVTLLVIFSTSYYRHDRDNEQLPNLQDSQPPADVTPPVTPSSTNTTDDLNEEDEEPPLEDTIIYINEADPGINAILNYFASRHNCVAVSIVVYNAKARDFYTYQYGYKIHSDSIPVETDTVFCVASLSKLVTTVVAMTLVDDGKLDLDTDISEYLGYTVINPHFPDTPITTRMLMQHTSSLYGPFAEYYDIENIDLPDTIKELLESGTVFADHEPGTIYIYSPFLAHSIIGLICETISGKRFDDYARDVLFNPMDIDAAYIPGNLRNTENIAVHYGQQHEIIYSIEDLLSVNNPIRNQSEEELPQTRISDHDRLGAHLMISTFDYSKILIMLGNEGVYNGVRILSEESVKEIHNANVPVDTQIYLEGLSTRLQTNPYRPFEGFYWHPGGAWGVNAYYFHLFDEDTNRGLVVITTGADFEAVYFVAMDLALVSWQVLA